ncbi:MAG: DegT/DnrJ/EryC1/StrS aminotransferase family protein [bacterium]|nr:DegT/DnrJ/EryC1/StrS aminotransferase family protein [bacterium]
MTRKKEKIIPGEIPFSVPYIGEQEIAEVVKVLRGKWITTGSEADLFEKRVKRYLGVGSAIALSSGTAALNIALAFHGVGEGDRVLTTAYTFASSVLAIVHRGAEPVFADVEPDTFNISPKSIEREIHDGYRWTGKELECKRTGKKLRGILTVHFGGQPCEVEAIDRIARQYNLFVVEDAAHAIGAQHKGVKIGKSTNLVCFSFYSNKNMTTAEGGMVVTDNVEAEKIMRMYSLHGISKTNRQRYHTGLPFYDVVYPGFKANMPDIQAALGVVQIKKLDAINRSRNRIADWYDRFLADEEKVITPVVKDYNYSSRHLYPVLLDPSLKHARDDVILGLRKRKIFPSVHFIPIHFHTFFKNYLDKRVRVPVTEDLFYREISLPIFPGLKKSGVEYVVDTLKEIVKKV